MHGLQKRRISVKGVILLAAVCLWLAFCLYLSHQDGEHTYEVSINLAKRLFGLSGRTDTGQLEAVNSALRHLAHVGLYAVLAILMLAAFDKLWHGRAAAAVIILAAIAVLDEVTKIPIEGRHCSLADIGLNILGAAAGAAAVFLARAISSKHKTCKGQAPAAFPREVPGGPVHRKN